MITVSTAAELIRVIAPDAHIILKPGDYNFSDLTEEEIEGCSDYVDRDYLLNYDNFLISGVTGLTLETAEDGMVELVTENGGAMVLDIRKSDNVALRGLTCGHVVERGECSGSVLYAEDCKNLTIEGCHFYGCGTEGIWTQRVDGLTVTGTEIYECSESVFSLDGKAAIFDRCRFYSNYGSILFYFSDGTDILVKDTEIYDNQGYLMLDYTECGEDTDNRHITFRNCIFRDNRRVDRAPASWPCATFEDCEFSSVPTPVSAGNAYDALIQRYRQIVADPYGSSAETAGERCVLTAARDMLEWDENPLTALGYAVEDLSGDGVPELVIGYLPDHSIFLYVVYTLVDGRPQVVFEDEEDSLGYLGNGSFHYVANLPTGMGLGTVSLSNDGAQILWGDFYFTVDDIFGGGAVTIYHNTTGSLDPAESELTDWTMEYLYAWEPEYEELPMIPFSAD